MIHPLPGPCPICGGEMQVTRLHCEHCDVSIEGRFTAGRLGRLTPEQLHFVETFIRCEGTIKRVERDLGISYPTVRARLREVIRALGFEVLSDYAEEESHLPRADRQDVLNRLERGEITSDEAVALLHGHEH